MTRKNTKPALAQEETDNCEFEGQDKSTRKRDKMSKSGGPSAGPRRKRIRRSSILVMDMPLDIFAQAWNVRLIGPILL